MLKSQIQEPEAGELVTLPIDRTTTQYEASLFLSYGILLTREELSLLLDRLDNGGVFSLFRTGALLPKEKLKLSRDEFLDSYQKSLLFPDASLSKEEKAALSSIWSWDDKAISFRELTKDKWQVAKQLPVVQLSRFQFRFDKRVDRFFTHSFSQDSIHWGIELKFPQLFIDPISKKAVRVLKDPRPNTALWKEIHSWIRNSTVPVKLEVDIEGAKIEQSKARIAPFRIGRLAFDLGEEILKRQTSQFKLMRIT